MRATQAQSACSSTAQLAAWFLKHACTVGHAVNLLSCEQGCWGSGGADGDHQRWPFVMGNTTRCPSYAQL